MELISNKNLDKELEVYRNQDVLLELDGIITTKIIINNARIKITEDEIVFFNDDEEKLSINLHQVLKIQKLENEKIKIELDQLQSIIISNRIRRE